MYSVPARRILYLWVWSAHPWGRLQAMRRHATAVTRCWVAWAMLQHTGNRSWSWAVWQERPWTVEGWWMLLHHGRRWWWHHGWLGGGRVVNWWRSWRSQRGVNDYWLLLWSIRTKTWRTNQKTGRANTSRTLLLTLFLLLFVAVLLQGLSTDHSKKIPSSKLCYLLVSLSSDSDSFSSYPEKVSFRIRLDNARNIQQDISKSLRNVYQLTIWYY